MKILLDGYRRCWPMAVLACILITAGCANLDGDARPADVPEIGHGFLMGYLPKDALPNSLALLPAPPGEGSAAFALDQAVANENVALRGSARWRLATADAELNFPAAAASFSCALAAPITEENTPHLYQLLRRTLTDAGLSTYAAKDYYKRTRPFVINKQPICTPEQQSGLAQDGSYPSGHTAIGWAWALVLAEISPAQSDAILVRGRAFGQSRNVCNVHWHSDVIGGYFMGAATVAVLHADPVFRADLEAARAELAAVRGKGLQPLADCSSEAAALAR